MAIFVWNINFFFLHEINCEPFLCENGEHFYEKNPAFSMYGCVGVCVCVWVCVPACVRLFMYVC